MSASGQFASKRISAHDRIGPVKSSCLQGDVLCKSTKSLSEQQFGSARSKRPSLSLSTWGKLPGACCHFQSCFILWSRQIATKSVLSDAPKGNLFWNVYRLVLVTIDFQGLPFAFWWHSWGCGTMDAPCSCPKQNTRWLFTADLCNGAVRLTAGGLPTSRNLGSRVRNGEAVIQTAIALLSEFLRIIFKICFIRISTRLVIVK